MQIENLFDEIRKTYYPDWDSGGEWSVKLLSSRDPRLRFAQGRCDEETKSIFVNEFQIAGTDPEKLELLLIHEIAHASTRNNHRKEWLAQMKRAAGIAQSIGRKSLADHIRKQIREYEGSY